MSKDDEKKAEVIFRNNIKSPSMQPFGRRKLMIFLSSIFVITGTMNFFNSIFYFNQIFNPISFTISSIEEKNYTFKTYNEYINEIEKDKSLLKADIRILLSKIIYRDPYKISNITYNETIENLIEYAHGNYIEIEKIKLDILGDIVNYAVLSIFLVVAAIFTFALRNYNDDWQIDMRFYFLVLIR